MIEMPRKAGGANTPKIKPLTPKQKTEATSKNNAAPPGVWKTVKGVRTFFPKG